MLPAGNLDEVEGFLLTPGYLPAASSVHYTTSCKQSSAPEFGRNYRTKRVELTGIINKPLLLHLVGCLCYCISDARSYKHQTQDVTMYCVRLFHFNVSSPIIITLSGIKSHVVFAWLADFYLLFIKAVCMKAKRSVPCKIQLMFLLPPLACIIFTKLCHVMYLSIHQLNCRY